MPRRIIGQDRAPVNERFLTQVSQEQQAQTQLLANVFERSRDTATAINQGAINSLMATREALNTHAMVAAQRQVQPQQNIFDAIASGLDNFSQANKIVLKDVLDKQSQLAEQENFLATLAVEELVANGELMIMETSPQAFESDAHRVIGGFRNLTPKMALDHYGKVYGVIERVNNRIAEERRAGMRATRDEIKAQKVYRLKLRLDGIASELEVADGNEDELFKRWNLTLNDFLANNDLTPIESASVQTESLKWLAESSRSNMEVKAEVNRQLLNLQSFQKAVQQAKIEHPNNPLTQQSLIKAASVRYQIPSSEAFQIANPTNYAKELLDVKQTMQKLRDIETKNIQTGFNKIEYEDAYVGYRALVYLNDVQYRSVVDAQIRDNKDNLSASIKSLAGEIESYNSLVKANESRIFNNVIAIKNLDRSAALFLNNFQQGKETFESALDARIHLLQQAGETAVLSELQKKLAQQPALPNPTDPATVQAETVDNWVKFTIETKDVLIRQNAGLQKEIENKGQILDRYGILTPEKFSDEAYIQQLQQNFINQRKKAAGIIQAIPPDSVETGTSVNFKSGDPLKHLSVKSTRYNQTLFVPFKPGSVNVSIGDGHGVAGSPNHGRDRDHAGLDFRAPLGTEIVSLVDGKVLKVLTQVRGYGNMVDILDTSTKLVHRFAHLEKPSTLKPGQAIKSGDLIGYVGATDGGAGTSTGPHLHFEIRNESNDGFTGTHDPELLLAGQASLRKETTEGTPRTDNLGDYVNVPNPYQNTTLDDFSDLLIPARAFPLFGGSYIMNNGITNKKTGHTQSLEETITTANRLVSKFAPIDKQGFNAQRYNQSDRDYGYAFLARSDLERAKLNQVATALDIPGNWLADIIALESKFNPAARNSAGATGLIQFYPVEGTSGMTWGKRTTSDLEKMSFVQQMDVVRDYLSFPEFQGKLTTLPRVAAAVFGGFPLLDLYIRNPKAALKRGDSAITFETYLDKLGASANRKYNFDINTSRSHKYQPIHQSFVTGCAICKALKKSGSAIVPHQEQAG